VMFGSSGTLELNTSGTLTASYMVAIGAGTLKLDGAGTQFTAAFTNTIAGGTISGTGTIAANTNFTGHGTVSIPISNASTLVASGGTLNVQGAVGSSATLQIAAGSSNVLQLDGSVAAGTAVSFLGAAGTHGVLDITSAPGTFQGTITLNVGSDTNLADNDDIQFGSNTVTSASLTDSTHLQVVTSGGTYTLTLANAVNTSTTFADWSGSDAFLSTAACFSRGTLISTPEGEVLVEALAIGAAVMTLGGQARPIRWIGRRAYDGRFIAGNRKVLPIRIAADAMAPGVPARDLYLSPEHSLYIDGVLVQAKDLVNGATIVQADGIDRVEYFHLELDDHDVIFADGAAAETFVDCDNRLMFANGAEYARLYPDDERPRWKFCAERLGWDSDELTDIRAALLWRAAALGHDLDRDPDLHLIVDGAVIRPDSVADLVYRFTIPAGSSAVSLASRSSVPAETVAQSRDSRRLGLPVERIVLSDEDLLIEVRHGHAGLANGFHADETGHRWTDGLARLPESLVRPFAGAFTLELRLVPSDLSYQIPPPLDTATTA